MANIKQVESELVCIASFLAKEGKENELIEALYSLIEATHKEEGCIRYELNQAIEEPRRITFIEKWSNQKTFDEHCAMPYITDYFDNVRPALVESFDVSLHKEFIV
ncbi:MAG: antibiotic biosynthesis monooxygenase [Cytophagales bacterium]|nr:antibiotic biosynthesis monooxygenase [Cytophagales bacterium]